MGHQARRPTGDHRSFLIDRPAARPPDWSIWQEQPIGQSPDILLLGGRVVGGQ